MEKEIYKNITGWEKILSKPSRAFQIWFAAEKKFFKENITPKSKVLEVGCGDGRSLKDVLGITKNIIGVDHDETAVKHARNNFKSYPSIKIVLAEGIKLPFDNKIFDYVTCIGTFGNFGEDKYPILSEMKRTLKDNGKIIISVYSEDALEERLKAYKKINVAGLREINNKGTVLFDDSGKVGISEQFSKEELFKIFNKVKLKVDKIVKSGIGYICLLSK